MLVAAFRLLTTYLPEGMRDPVAHDDPNKRVGCYERQKHLPRPPQEAPPQHLVPRPPSKRSPAALKEEPASSSNAASASAAASWTEALEKEGLALMNLFKAPEEAPKAEWQDVKELRRRWEDTQEYMALPVRHAPPLEVKAVDEQPEEVLKSLPITPPSPISPPGTRRTTL